MSLGPSLRRLNSFHQKQIPRQNKCFYQSNAFTLESENRTASNGLDGFCEAQQMFDEIPQKDSSETNHLLFQYTRNNLKLESLNFFVGIRRLGLSFDGSSLSCVLKVCGCLFNQVIGKQVHGHCIKSGFVEDVSVETSLIDMYVKTENVVDGKGVFSEMPDKNVVSWTSLLAGYTRNGLFDEAIELFFQMQMDGIKPNPFTFAAVLGALANNGSAEKGLQVHTTVIKNGFELTTYVGNSLINMYSKSGLVIDARAVFDDMESKDVVSWNGMISGFVTNGFDLEALALFYRMRLAGVKLTQPIFVTVIKLCANFKEVGFARL